MKISKAIENLTIELGAWPHKGSEEWYDTMKLAIDCLKFRLNMKNKWAGSMYDRLDQEEDE